MKIRAIKVIQCYFCPFWIPGNSSAIEDHGFCMGEKNIMRSLHGQDLHKIPQFCPLEKIEIKEGENEQNY